LNNIFAGPPISRSGLGLGKILGKYSISKKDSLNPNSHQGKLYSGVTLNPSKFNT